MQSLYELCGGKTENKFHHSAMLWVLMNIHSRLSNTEGKHACDRATSSIETSSCIASPDRRLHATESTRLSADGLQERIGIGINFSTIQWKSRLDGVMPLKISIIDWGRRHNRQYKVKTMMQLHFAVVPFLWSKSNSFSSFAIRWTYEWNFIGILTSYPSQKQNEFDLNGHPMQMQLE